MIDSPSNAIVKALQALATSKGRREQGHFLVEGVRLVSDALRVGCNPTSALFNSDMLGKTPEGRQVLAELRALQRQNAGGLVSEASERAIGAASDTRHPQGVVASFAPPSWEPPSALETPLVLICDDIQDPGNLGTILRSAEASGATAIFLTPNCVDLYNPKVVRAGMGAHFRLPAFPEVSWEWIRVNLIESGVPPEHVFATDASAVLSYDRADWKQAAAVIISNEAHGLSNEARQAAGGGLLSIPMQGGTESLNAAMAATIILFEVARQRREANHAS
ncbi:MAG TPA: RNA methyltransferase [Chloroflexia bacterium]|nr:RNA methyltransferase [Chloroflexia bacterium]